jgi:Leucine-rich repeat (LRR) protein
VLTVNIPDDNFLNALLELDVDTDGDGLVSPDEAAIITSLDVSFQSIADMTGIEAFVNLDNLSCQYNQLTTLDVSNNTVLG